MPAHTFHLRLLTGHLSDKAMPAHTFHLRLLTGHLPDLSDAEDQARLGTEAFAFVNVARLAVPLRIGLALGTTPWVQANIVDRFQKPPLDGSLSESQLEATVRPKADDAGGAQE